MEVSPILHVILVHMRLMLYPICALSLTILTFSGTKWRETKSYLVNMGIVFMFMVLEFALVLRIVNYDVNARTFILDYGLTTALVLIIVSLCTQIIRQEKQNLREIEEKNGHSYHQ